MNYGKLQSSMIRYLPIIVLILVCFCDNAFSQAKKPATAPAAPKQSAPAGKQTTATQAAKEDAEEEAAAEPEEEAAPVKKKADDIDEATKEELEYASALRNNGLSVYAKMVLDKIKDPRARIYVEAQEYSTLLAMGKFDDVIKKISARPDQDSEETWTLRLTVANYYYSWGKYPQAEEIYQGFFTKYAAGPPKGLTRFYVNAAYTYAQMLKMMKKEKNAIEAFNIILKLPKGAVEEGELRQVKYDTADLMVRYAERNPGDADSMLKEAEKITGSLMWIPDIFYAKSIALRSEIKMIRGDVKGAMGILEDKETKSQLEEFDRQLREGGGASFSPLAQVLYLTGNMLLKEAEKQLAAKGDKDKIKILLAGREIEKGKRVGGAIQNFVKVFTEYSQTPYAGEAAMKTRRVEDIMREEFAYKAKSFVDEDMLNKIMASQFQEARSKYNQGQWVDAIESYHKTLAIFPESEVAVQAVGELCRCYNENNEEMFSDTVFHYMVERFGLNKKYDGRAGDEVIKIAEYYGQNGKPEKRKEAYEAFFDNFPRHGRIPQLLYYFGEQNLASTNIDEALKYYRKIVDNYTNSVQFPDAMSRLVQCYSKKGNKEAERETMESLVAILEKESKPTAQFLNAKAMLAYTYKGLGTNYIEKAVQKYEEIIKELNNPKSPYISSKDTVEAAKKVLEGSYYFLAQCYSMVQEPDENKVKENRIKAAALLEKLLAEYPKSQFIPASLNWLGSIYMILEDSEKSEKVLGRLMKEFPDSPEAQNAVFNRAFVLLKMGKRKQAISEFKKMFDGSGGKFNDAQIRMAGSVMLEEREYEIALQAYDVVIKNAPSSTSSNKESMIHDATYSRGICLTELGKGPEAVVALEQYTNMVKKYSTQREIDMRQLMSKAYQLAGMQETDKGKRKDLFNNAVASLNKAKKLEKTKGGKRKLEVAIADMYINKAKAEEQFGTPATVKENKDSAIAQYNVIIMTGDAKDGDQAPHIQDAYYGYMKLLVEDGTKWPQAMDAAKKYISSFPQGKYLADIRSMQSKARVELSKLGIEIKDEDTGDILEEDTSSTNAAPDKVEGGNTNTVPASAETSTNAPATEVKEEASKDADADKTNEKKVEEKKPESTEKKAPEKSTVVKKKTVTKPAVKKAEPVEKEAVKEKTEDKPAEKPAETKPKEEPVETE